MSSGTRNSRILFNSSSGLLIFLIIVFEILSNSGLTSILPDRYKSNDAVHFGSETIFLPILKAS